MGKESDSIPPGSRKPVVGVVYSDGSKVDSLESKHMGLYLAGHIASTGFARVVCIGFHREAAAPSAAPERVLFVPVHSTRPIEAPASDLEFGYFNSITECHVLLVAISSRDTAAFTSRLREMIPDDRVIVIFCMQRGVKSSAVLKDGLEEKKGAVVIECSMSFAVVPQSLVSGASSTAAALVSTSPQGGIVMQRLSREVVKHADGPVNLIEYTRIPVTFKKVLTPEAWGVVIFENLYCLNALSGGTLQDTLASPKWRLVFAAMIRESTESLLDAARGGTWRPSMETVLRFSASPWVLEMALVLPSLLFSLGAYVLSVPAPALPSPGLVDVAAGRRTDASLHLQELVDAGKKYKHQMGVCGAVLAMLEAVELSPQQQQHPTSQKLSRIVSDDDPRLGNLLRVVGISSSQLEVRFWAVRAATLLSFLALLYWLLLAH